METLLRSKPTVSLVSKETIAPRFGLFVRLQNGEQSLQIREDLPEAMRDFIEAHELAHSQDQNFKDESWILNELQANWAGFKKYPLGFFMVILWSLSWTRLKYYYSRFKIGGSSGEYS